MNEQEEDLAERIYTAMQEFSINSERGQQAKEFRVGVSDLGYCSERVNRMLGQQVPDDTDMVKAFIGTALGDHVEQAILSCERLFPDAIRQAEVTLQLTGEHGTYNVPGHPDIVLPSEGIMLDAKTSDGLALARRLGADQQKQFQRHGYGLGAWEGGYFGDLPLEDVKVGNVWIDRSGDEPEPHVELVPYDPEVVAEAGRWLDEVIYSFVNGQPAMKEPAREVCAVTCGFFADCRQFDTDVTGLLSDPEVLEAIEMYVEGLRMEKDGKRLKEQAKPVLRGISGSDGSRMLRWVHVNESLIPETHRRAYDKIDLRVIR